MLEQTVAKQNCEHQHSEATTHDSNVNQYNSTTLLSWSLLEFKWNHKKNNLANYNVHVFIDAIISMSYDNTKLINY